MAPPAARFRDRRDTQRCRRPTASCRGRRAVIFQIVGDLRGAEERIVETVVVAVHENERLILEFPRTAQPLADERQQLLPGERFYLLDGEVLLGVLVLLIEDYARVGDLDRPWSLDVRHLMGLGYRHERPPNLEAVPSVRAVADALGLIVALLSVP